MSSLLRYAFLLLATGGHVHAAVCVAEHATLEDEWIVSAKNANYVLVATVGRTVREVSNQAEIKSYLVAPLFPVEVLKGHPPAEPLLMRLAQLRVVDSVSWGGPFAWEGDRLLLFLREWSVSAEDFSSGCLPGSSVIGNHDSHEQAMQGIEPLRQHLRNES
jgi:hypothetical protein